MLTTSDSTCEVHSQLLPHLCISTTNAKASEIVHVLAPASQFNLTLVRITYLSLLVWAHIVVLNRL